MIEAHNIYKSFGDNKVLDDVSCSFEPGKTNLIIGGSGSGKTVLMKCCVGLHEVDEGHIDYDDENFSEMSFNERKKVRIQIGMVFQAGALFDSLSIEDNIMFPLKMFTNMTLDERRERANVCLNRVNLENVNNLLPSEISGGMQKRVAIARAIVNNPNYLFCDEPNSGLDPQTAIVIDNLIHEITEEYQMTTIINTHDMNSVLEIGQNIIYLYQGKKWWEGNKDDILHTDNKELNDFVFASKMLKSLRK
ncbi:MAG: ATP-binding cassette domain-containing protein [Bacteroidia bacterium]|nr:ATP-binding cassette domain-containing protein [Bacteroidia bacterium]NNM15067.1 ATP-binding cassette domain-containing protein [Bacteroidia bacterium]